MEAASNIHDTAFDEQLTCGYGGWRYLTEVEEDSFLDFILSLKARGFNYQVISEKQYNYYKADLKLKDYTTDNTAVF